jgi:hydroxyacylglutathione hydrolase
MKLEQIYTGCLAQGAYYIQSENEAVIIDPLREVQPYIDMAARNGARIKYVFETHFHADFVSGHLDLARATGASIIYGPTAKPGFEAIVAADGEQFQVGKVTFTVLHTPGHTLESSCFLLTGESGQPTALFSGDTLFIGDVGRPDLAQGATGLTQEELAGMLYDSLQQKILPLPDDIIIYPAHGAGSACGKNLSSETTDTLGHQRKFNYALRPGITRKEFIREVLAGLMPPPQYFPENVRMNKKGYENIGEVLKRGSRALSPREFEATANETGALVLDTRDAADFAQGFIPGSINIGVKGNFAPWVGALIQPITQPILIVANPGDEQEVVTRLARVGYDNAIGFLKGGFPAWQHAGFDVDSVISISAEELAAIRSKNPHINILDIRKTSEFESHHVLGAENISLDYINQNMGKIARDKIYYVHCAGGYRSMIFISIMRARGFRKLIDVRDGFKGIQQSGKFRLSAYVPPVTML